MQQQKAGKRNEGTIHGHAARPDEPRSSSLFYRVARQQRHSLHRKATTYVVLVFLASVETAPTIAPLLDWEALQILALEAKNIRTTLKTSILQGFEIPRAFFRTKQVEEKHLVILKEAHSLSLSSHLETGGKYLPKWYSSLPNCRRPLNKRRSVHNPQNQ